MKMNKLNLVNILMSAMLVLFVSCEDDKASKSNPVSNEKGKSSDVASISNIVNTLTVNYEVSGNSILIPKNENYISKVSSKNDKNEKIECTFDLREGMTILFEVNEEALSLMAEGQNEKDTLNRVKDSEINKSNLLLGRFSSNDGLNLKITEDKITFKISCPSEN